MNKQPLVSARITPSMKETIDKFLSHDMHISISDFIRDAIREKIKQDAPELYANLFREATAE